MDPARQGAPACPAGSGLLSARVRSIAIAPTIAMSERAAELRARGEDVVNLAVGEPDFPTPPEVVDAAHEAARRGFTRYTAPDGAALVKDAVRVKLARDGLPPYGRSAIHVASGAKQVISNALAATLDAGDEVVVIAPAWVSYADMAAFHGGTPVIVRAEAARGFVPDVAAIRAALTPRTKWVLVNSPNNPTGAVYPAGRMAAIAQAVAAHPRALLLSDEIYDQLVLDGGPHVSAVAAAPSLAGRILLVNGVSKSYAMTGWRIGFAAGPEWLIAAMAKVQSQLAGSASSVSQAAAAAALEGDQSRLGEWRSILRRRRDAALAALGGTNRLAPFPPSAAFYIFADVSRAIGARTPAGRLLATDTDVSEYLLEAAHVATVPGSAFSASPWVRLSFALEEERLVLACERIAQALNRLCGPDEGGERDLPDSR